MQTTGRIEPSGSAAPGIVPDPVNVHDEAAAAGSAAFRLAEVYRDGIDGADRLAPATRKG